MREHLEAIFRAGVEACLPARVVPPNLPEPPAGRTVLLALGKAAVGMAEAVPWHCEGLAVAPHGTASGRLPLLTAGHPLPDQASVEAAKRLLALARTAGPDDLVLVLLSGGASALACLPGGGLDLDQKRGVIEALLRSGAGISEINCVRRHLSAFKGGRLALAAAPARLLTLAISDTVGDRPEDIGSGPTAADPTGIADARAILARHALPAPEAGWSETPVLVEGDYRVIADNDLALKAAAAEARRLGYRPVALGQCEGEAREVASAHAALAREAPPGTAFISGGELTVTVTGSGCGGPNLEYALALAGEPGLRGLAADSDGKDGTSNAAGAFFGGLDRRGAEAALAANDSHGWLERRGALFVTGPTGNNVNDLRILIVAPRPTRPGPRRRR